jgi:hypothetical protein
MVGGMATPTAWNTLPHTPSALLRTARRLPFSAMCKNKGVASQLFTIGTILIFALQV